MKTAMDSTDTWGNLKSVSFQGSKLTHAQLCAFMYSLACEHTLRNFVIAALVYEV